MIEQIRDRLRLLREEIAGACEKAGRSPDEITVIVVTKNHPVEVLQACIDAGNPAIGENRVQEILQKAPYLHGNRSVHLVGHLQTNKVGKVAPLVEWVHSVDTQKLAEKLNSQCMALNKKMNVLVQVNTSDEESKSGCAPLDAVMLCEKVSLYPFLNFRGLMTIGLLGGTGKQTRQCFVKLRSIGEQCAGLTGDRVELSMGMSDDFKIAIEEGATMIRIGTYILGSRSQ